MIKENSIEELVRKYIRKLTEPFDDLDDYETQGALVIVMRDGLNAKKDAELQKFVGHQLERGDLSPPYRNILILLSDVRYDLITQKLSLSSSLPRHMASLNPEIEEDIAILIHAIELFSGSASGFRSGVLREYLNERLDLEIRMSALKGIQRVFRDEPPDEDDLGILSDLRQAVIDLSRGYIPVSYAQDGEFTGDLGEEPIYASAVLFDPNLLGYIEEYARNTILDWVASDPCGHGDIGVPQFLISQRLYRIARNWQRGYKENLSLLENPLLETPISETPIMQNVVRCANILYKKVKDDLDEEMKSREADESKRK